MVIVKRDGTEVSFNSDKIYNAIMGAMKDTKEPADTELAKKITSDIAAYCDKCSDLSKSVAEISDLIENKLMASKRKDVAKQFIIYRNYRDANREDKPNRLLSKEFLSGYKHLPSPMTALGEFVYYRTYSRWVDSEQRRESWWETVRRAVEYNCSLAPGVSVKEAEQIYDNMFNLKQFVSGRTLWVADTVAATEVATSNFNCAHCIIDDYSKFNELFYLLMVGAGVGFRILKTDVAQMSKIRTKFDIVHKIFNGTPKPLRSEYTSLNFNDKIVEIIIGDSKNAWEQAIEYYFKMLTRPSFKNIDTIIMNYDNIRLKGERLKCFGGTASGYESLKTMFEKITMIIQNADTIDKNGLCQLRPIHCMDICNIIGENVVVGGRHICLQFKKTPLFIGETA